MGIFCHKIPKIENNMGIISHRTAKVENKMCRNVFSYNNIPKVVSKHFLINVVTVYSLSLET